MREQCDKEKEPETGNNIVVFSHEQFIRALLMEQGDSAFQNADMTEKMRLFRCGRRIANAEINWLKGLKK